MLDTPAMRPTTLRARRGVLTEARAVMQQRMADPDLTIDDVALAVATSRRQLQRCFDLAGTTFRDDLLRMRMIVARHLLVQRGLPVRAVLPYVGYRHGAQFAKAFRRVFGMSPTELRAREYKATAG